MLMILVFRGYSMRFLYELMYLKLIFLRSRQKTRLKVVKSMHIEATPLIELQ